MASKLEAIKAKARNAKSLAELGEAIAELADVVGPKGKAGAKPASKAGAPPATPDSGATESEAE